jgi:GTPase SAR1 family protein
MREDGADRDLRPSPEAAAALVEQRIHELAFAALADDTKVHAGSATWRDRRLLVVGAGGSGKSTLMARLLFEGFAVEGDEMVLLREGRAVAYPRRFGIRQPTLALVPQLSALTPGLAGTPEPHGENGFPVLALDPAQLGFEWRIGSGPVHHLFLLDGHHAGPTRVAPCPSHMAVRQVMTHSSPPSGGRAAWVRDVCATVAGARCHSLVLGDLDSASDVLRQCLEAPPTITTGYTSHPRGDRDGR